MEADHINKNRSISGFYANKSSNRLCGMQDVKNLEEKSTLSAFYQDGVKHPASSVRLQGLIMSFFKQIIPNLIVPGKKMIIISISRAPHGETGISQLLQF